MSEDTKKSKSDTIRKIVETKFNLPILNKEDRESPEYQASFKEALKKEALKFTPVREQTESSKASLKSLIKDMGLNFVDESPHVKTAIEAQKSFAKDMELNFIDEKKPFSAKSIDALREKFTASSKEKKAPK